MACPHLDTCTAGPFGADSCGARLRAGSERHVAVTGRSLANDGDSRGTGTAAHSRATGTRRTSHRTPLDSAPFEIGATKAKMGTARDRNSASRRLQVTYDTSFELRWPTLDGWCGQNWTPRPSSRIWKQRAAFL